MTDEFRLGGDHFTDISAVVADLNKRFPGLSVFLIGTSRGTVSAAALGARFGTKVAGIVLTATMFREVGRNSNEPGPALSRFDFHDDCGSDFVCASCQRSMPLHALRRCRAPI